uniref:Secreted protein n=1 Tax=Physcomitrium patens TaxID=3218 RepID=A0A2K1L7B4_PHYPA|nr:hypothetical protein PHYPA_000360 [Physcomitrium patens]
MLHFAAILVGLVLFEATMVMTTSLCGGCTMRKRKKLVRHDVLCCGGRSGVGAGPVVRAEVRKDLFQ